MIKYVYDAWGNCKVLNPDGTENTTADFLGNLNAYRYRGYYFCTEIGLYYLKARFYDPEVGRFINADSVEYLDPSSVNCLNLYAYCGNNPVMNLDPDGNSFLTALAVIVLGGLIGAFVGSLISDIQKLFNGTVGYRISKSDEIEILNSHLINNPLVQFGNSFYLNHINQETRDIIKGTSFGVQGEWMAHNIAYYLAKAGKAIFPNFDFFSNLGRCDACDKTHGHWRNGV